MGSDQTGYARHAQTRELESILEERTMTTISRRSRIDLLTPAELAIVRAVEAVEAAGCDPLLTEAVILLDQARDRVADFVDRDGTDAST